MAVLDDMDRKLDTLLAVMREEINVHPDVLRPEAVIQVLLPLTWNSSVSMSAEIRIQDMEGGRYLVLRLRDAMGYWVLDRRWRAVYRDPLNPTEVIDRPGKDTRFNAG